MSSNQDFGVEQFFRADDFQAVDPSPLIYSPAPKSLIILCLTFGLCCTVITTYVLLKKLKLLKHIKT